MLAMPDGTAYRIQRRKNARHKRRRVIAQIEVLDMAGNETGILKQFQHRFFRIIDDVPRNIQAVPFCAERFELPAVDIRNLKDDRAVWLQDAKNFGECMTGGRTVFQSMKTNTE